MRGGTKHSKPCGVDQYTLRASRLSYESPHLTLSFYKVRRGILRNVSESTYSFSSRISRTNFVATKWSRHQSEFFGLFSLLRQTRAFVKFIGVGVFLSIISKSSSFMSFSLTMLFPSSVRPKIENIPNFWMYLTVGCRIFDVFSFLRCNGVRLSRCNQSRSLQKDHHHPSQLLSQKGY